MIYEVFIGTGEAGVFTCFKYKNESIAEQIFNAALKWGRVAFVLTYPQQ